MHKIKEMLHKDDSSSSETSKDAKHSHDTHSHDAHSHDAAHTHGTHSHDTHSHDVHSHDTHAHDHKHGKTEEGHLSTKEFKHDHVKHGELEHGSVHTHTTEHTHHAEHGLKTSGGEKHVYHEREVIKGGDLYREGADPTLKREVASEVRHEGEVKREVVGEAKIVKETIKEVELHKVQPVIHREREQKEIRHVVEPHQKFEVKDTKVLHTEKDIDLGTRREASTLESSRAMDAPHIESSREFLATERQHQELPMRVEEHVHKKVEEHIHPVIYKEVLKPKVTEETHHIYETVKEKPIETYEVRELHSHGTGLREAERSFFSEQTSRGIDVDMHSHSHTHSSDVKHAHSHDHEHGHSHSHEHAHAVGHDHGHTHSHEHAHALGHDHGHAHGHEHVVHTETRHIETGHVHSGNTMNEPIVGHHQNIGGHHVAGAIPAGHNTAYDAALCNECTGNKVCSHGARDAALMQKMNEKKIVKDKALKKEEKKH